MTNKNYVILYASYALWGKKNIQTSYVNVFAEGDRSLFISISVTNYKYIQINSLESEDVYRALLNRNIWL